MALTGMALLAASLCIAELPPHAYEAMAKRSTEVLCIRVDDVTRLWLPWGDYVHVTGQVLQVVRSQSGLQEGGKVHFSYKRKPFGSSNPGPSDPPVAKEDTIVPVYLKSGEDPGDLNLGAGSKSFMPIVKSDWLSACE